MFAYICSHKASVSIFPDLCWHVPFIFIFIFTLISIFVFILIARDSLWKRLRGMLACTLEPSPCEAPECFLLNHAKQIKFANPKACVAPKHFFCKMKTILNVWFFNIDSTSSRVASAQLSVAATPAHLIRESFYWLGWRIWIQFLKLDFLRRQ